METQYDISNLTARLSELTGVLLGNGASKGNLQRVLEIEAGQCALKISNGLGPTSSIKANQQLDKDVRQFLTDKPSYSNLDSDQQYSSVNEFTWLSAGPNYLLGVNDEDNQSNADISDALGMYYGNKKYGSRGNAYIPLGKRGKQSVLRLNRIRVKASVLNGVKKNIALKFGQNKAAFARTAMQYLRRTFPAWIARNIPVVIENGKSILDDSKIANQSSPYIEFGSRAPGVTTRDKSIEAIRSGIEQSKYSLGAKIKKVLAGYVYDWNTGQVFKPKSDEFIGN